jgi:hypothetical protein
LGPRGSLDLKDKIQISCPYRESKPGSSFVQPVVGSRTELSRFQREVKTDNDSTMQDKIRIEEKRRINKEIKNDKEIAEEKK